jgi:hypothetical protein
MNLVFWMSIRFLLPPHLWPEPISNAGQREGKTRTHHSSPDVSNRLFSRLFHVNDAPRSLDPCSGSGQLNVQIRKAFAQYEHDPYVDVIENWSSGPMLIMEVFSAALHLADPELNRAQGRYLLTELSI